jgi:hypothetical protein
VGVMVELLLLRDGILRPRSQVPKRVKAAILGSCCRQGRQPVRVVDAFFADAPTAAVAAAKHTVEAVALASQTGDRAIIVSAIVSAWRAREAEGRGQRAEGSLGDGQQAAAFALAAIQTGLVSALCL